MLRSFLRGDYSLAASFWLFYVLGFLIASIVLVLVGSALYRLHLEPFGRVLLVSIPLYPLFAAVGVWRSATAYPFTGAARFWAWAAKGIVASTASTSSIRRPTAARPGSRSC